HAPAPTSVHPPSLHDALPIWGTEDPTYRLAHVAAGVWGEVTAEETHLYIRGNYQPVTLPGGNALLYYDDDSSSDLAPRYIGNQRSEEHTSELQSRFDLVCRLL